MRGEHPWLAIPAADYEGHMAEVGQLGPLREIFALVYGELRPRRLAVLGCGPGNGLEAVDPAITGRLVAVDLNPEYLALARQRHARLAAIADWRCGPIEGCDLGSGELDLVHAALLLEHLEPAPLLARIARWLAPGGVFSVVLQLPGADAPVSPTGFSSLGALEPLMRLFPPERLEVDAGQAGLALRSSRRLPLPRGKGFWVGTFGRLQGDG